MRNIIMFDLDGTVLDSKPGIFRSAAYALKKLGFSMPSDDEMMAFLGPPLSDGFANVCHIPHDWIQNAIVYYREYYTNGGMFEASIYNGIEEVIDTLHQHGKRCFITTSKPQIYAQRILERFKVAGLFDGLYGCELNGERSHKSEVVSFCLEQQGALAGDSVLIGDRHFDVNGAKMLEIPCIGVLYGYGSKEELEHAGAMALCATPEELLDVLL